MSSELAVKIENLSKCYQVYERPHERLKQFVMPRLRCFAGLPAKHYYREFWALKSVSFEVKKGETVGIIGRNGSGKSTLLQIICGTLSPTSGSVTAHGRVAALLELGAGFNPEFTGRENVFMNASVLGLSKNEVDARFDEIAAFADIGEFIEQPVKTYSSGMIMRLAFAVAINVDPEILIVDEALSVGDELFQRKCFSRIETIRSAGATILFVSHSGSTIVELCNHALLLDSGELLAMGVPKRIVGRYQKLLYAPQEKREAVRDEIRQEEENAAEERSKPYEFNSRTSVLLEELAQSLNIESKIHDSFDPSLKPLSTIAYGSHDAIIHDPAVHTLGGERVNNLTRGNVYFFRYRVVFNRPASNVKFGMLIKTTSGVELGGAISSSSKRTSSLYATTGNSFLVEFEFVCRLNAGVYFMNAGVVGDVNGSETYLHRLVDVTMFRVMSETNNLGTGVIDFSCLSKVQLEKTS